MTDPLCKLFGSPARVKLLRLFLFNPRLSFTVSDAARRARVSEADTNQEVHLFREIALIRRSLRGKSTRFTLNEDFPYTESLQRLLLGAITRHEEVKEHFKGTGTLKCIVLSGVFMGQWDSGGIDILIVGDRLQERKIQERVRRLEADLGKELRYAILSASDFFYRFNMNDKLVRDIFDYPHELILDKLNIGLK